MWGCWERGRKEWDAKEQHQLAVNSKRIVLAMSGQLTLWMTYKSQRQRGLWGSAESDQQPESATLPEVSPGSWVLSHADAEAVSSALIK